MTKRNLLFKYVLIIAFFTAAYYIFHFLFVEYTLKTAVLMMIFMLGHLIAIILTFRRKIISKIIVETEVYLGIILLVSL